MYVSNGVQILFAINMKLQVAKLGIAKIYFLKKKRILGTVQNVGAWHTFNFCN